MTTATHPDTASEAAFIAAWETFFRAARQARGRATQRSDRGLSLPQLQLLEPLAERPQPVRVLREAAGVTAPSATQMLDLLERRGLVTRGADPSDRRVVTISLTDAGADALAAKRAEVAGARARIAAQLTPAEREQAVVLLRRLAELVGDL